MDERTDERMDEWVNEHLCERTKESFSIRP